MTSELGPYLKARRGQVQPADVGLPDQGGRRVSGLRREEVAMLAGVSVDYYTRLEQGRERGPSPSVLHAIARALDLDADLREHLFRLAGLSATPDTPTASTVGQSLLDLLDAWPDTPALVLNRRLDILALNTLARALYSDFERADNLVRMTFLDPAGRHFFLDWARAAEAGVAHLRLALGHPQDNTEARALLARTYAASEEFRALWDRHGVRGKTRESKAFRHADVGDLVLEFQAFDVRDAPGQQLVVYRAAPGSASADNLRLLGSLAVTPAAGGPSAR